MKKKNIKFISVVTILVLLEITSVFLMYKSSTVQETKLDDVRLRKTANKNNAFAIMLEQSDGTYSASDSNTWPTDMKFNSDKSGCIDANGNKLDGALTYDSTNNIATVETGDTTYCYLYFDMLPTLSNLCISGENLGSCLTTNNSEIESLSDDIQGDMYRYQGTNDTVTDNYVCFGTTDSSECTSNTDAYMYRIIGVTEDNQLKLIKKEALNTAYKWNSSTEVTWAESELYTGINGDYYLSNSTYMPSGWSNKISNTSWKYGDITTYNTTASAVYTTENGWTSTTSAKIGLMYMHDYYYAYQSGGLNCSSSGSYTTCKTAWLHLSVNDSGAPSAAEWTMSRYNNYNPWNIDGNGSIIATNGISMNYMISIRPVFYLNADEVYMSGDGTIDNPIMLSEPELSAGETILASSPSGLNTSLEGGLYRFQGTAPNNYICFGTSTKSTCTGNTDQYMYRIIGINSSGQLKLIKKEALNSTMTWNSSTEVTWPNSGAYSSLNGSTFYTNTTYVPTSWQSKIAETSWKYGDITTYNTTASAVYTTESGWTSTTSAKIGLMYMHDYYYAYQSGGLNCSYDAGNYATCKTAWLHLSVNDSGAPSAHEWTMSRYSSYNAWGVYSSGYVDYYSPLYNTYSVRPVFYLTSDVQFVGGTGTSTDPFIIQ